jgi:AcrR family transcriptional regulator
MATGPEPEPPRRGRPRSEAAEQAIVCAVMRMLEQGHPLALLSIEGIAGEAGVGKATIYRRWSNKEELLIDVLQRMERFEPEPSPLDGSVRDALVAVLEYLRRTALIQRGQGSLSLLTAELRAMPELHRRYHETVIAPRRAKMRELLARGVAQGEIRGDVDLAPTHRWTTPTSRRPSWTRCSRASPRPKEPVERVRTSHPA